MRDIDLASSDRLLKKTFDDPLICIEQFNNRWFSIKPIGQSVSLSPCGSFRNFLSYAVTIGVSVDGIKHNQ